MSTGMELQMACVRELCSFRTHTLLTICPSVCQPVVLLACLFSLTPFAVYAEQVEGGDGVWCVCSTPYMCMCTCVSSVPVVCMYRAPLRALATVYYRVLLSLLTRVSFSPFVSFCFQTTHASPRGRPPTVCRPLTPFRV